MHTNWISRSLWGFSLGCFVLFGCSRTHFPALLMLSWALYILSEYQMFRASTMEDLGSASSGHEDSRILCDKLHECWKLYYRGLFIYLLLLSMKILGSISFVWGTVKIKTKTKPNQGEQHQSMNEKKSMRGKPSLVGRSFPKSALFNIRLRGSAVFSRGWLMMAGLKSYSLDKLFDIWSYLPEGRILVGVGVRVPRDY